MANLLDWQYESVDYPCIYVDANWAIYLEEVGDNTAFVHCKVNKWSHHKYKQMRAVWTTTLWSMFREKGYDKVWALLDNHKSIYFAHMFGFQYTDLVLHNKDNKEGRLMVCYC